MSVLSVEVINFIPGSASKIDIFAKTTSGSPTFRMKVVTPLAEGEGDFFVEGYGIPAFGRFDIVFSIQCPSKAARRKLLVWLETNSRMDLSGT